jgi:SAM-dependent methyltransferase
VNACGRRVLGAYAGAPVGARLHTAIRYATAPFGPLEAKLPGVGRFLDYGCGHGVLGLYLACTESGRRVHGVDVAADKVTVARTAAQRLLPAGGVEFQVVNQSWFPPVAAYDAVVCVDVLYLLGAEGASRTLRSLAAATKPGGLLLVKEMASSPRWKHSLTTVQERLSTGPLGLTQGVTVELLAPGWIRSTLESCGLMVEVARMDKWRPHPHLAFVARRPQ